MSKKAFFSRISRGLCLKISMLIWIYFFPAWIQPKTDFVCLKPGIHPFFSARHVVTLLGDLNTPPASLKLPKSFIKTEYTEEVSQKWERINFPESRIVDRRAKRLWRRFSDDPQTIRDPPFPRFWGRDPVSWIATWIAHWITPGSSTLTVPNGSLRLCATVRWTLSAIDPWIDALDKTRWTLLT